MAAWISVHDKLPGDGEKVLVYTKTDKQNVARYVKRRNEFIAAGNMTVTHWMPLPEAPGKGNDDG